MFRNRLMASNEPWSTFALANSLAGFIVGPLVVVVGAGLQNLVRRDGRGSRDGCALSWRAPVILVLLICLLLTKSRSACVGAAVGGRLCWRGGCAVMCRPECWRLTGWRVWASSPVSSSAASGHRPARSAGAHGIDQIAAYRWEYWRGTWGVITDGAPTSAGPCARRLFWAGVGPGNFGAHYVKYKLPQSSEEILDPHNMFLEVWATAGVWALVALLAALGCGLWNLLVAPRRPPRRQTWPEGGDPTTSRDTSPAALPTSPAPHGARDTWLAWSGRDWAAG